MNAYNYDPQTKEYLGLIPCQESPREPGIYLIPAYSTLTPLIEEISGKARCFIDNQWIYKDDNRGKFIYNIENSCNTIQITTLDYIIPENFTLIEPPDLTKWYKFNSDTETWLEYTPPPSLQDYDLTMEKHLESERVARGYTTREPSDYLNSTVARWAQDAQDWIAHRDAVMLYALDIENRYIESQGQTIVSLNEFKENLPKIHWTIDE